MDIPEGWNAAPGYTGKLHKLAPFPKAGSWATCPQPMRRPLRATYFAEHGGSPKTFMISGPETSQGWMYVKEH
jgi:hypothetical protein